VGTWSVISGSATIANINNPTTTLSAVGLGTNVLQWSITNNGACPLTSSTMTIIVNPAPSIATAGPTQTLCVLNPTTTLAANTPTSGVGTWSVISGSATIANINNPTTTLLAVGLGTNVLQWSITNNGACPLTSSTMTIIVNPAPSIATAGPTQTLCVLNPTTTLAANTPTSGVGTWLVISGAATIGNINNPTTTLSAVALGTNVLQWSITNNGACPLTSSTMTIIVNPAPSIATSGSNQTICISNPIATLAGNTPTSGIGTWSVISGSGTITSVNNPNTTVTNLGLGTNVLQWSITNNGVCPLTSSTMTIQVDNAPTTAVAGPSQTICISNPNYTMTGNTPVVGTGVWTMIFGSGTITTPNSGTTTITNLGLGQNIFSWTISNGVCAPSISNLILTVSPLPSAAVAATNTIICISTPTAALIGNTPAVGTGTWSVASGTGTITSPNSGTTTATSLGLGVNILQWSVGTVGCAPTISTISIQVDNVPTTSFAGPNQTLCINNPTTTLNANVPLVGAGTWSIIQGSGVIGSISLPTTSLTGLPTGTNILQWTIVNGVCAPSISTMSIQVDNNTVFASAGPNQTLCAASPSTTLAANLPTVGIGTWAVLVGSGSIATPSLSNSTITGLGTGTNILQWTIVNGVCSFNSSIVYIYVVPSPGVPNAGASQTLCINSPTTTISANTPSLGTASWSVVSGSANIVTPLTNTSSVLSLGLGNNILAWTMSYSVCSLTSTLNLHVDNIPSLPVAGPNQTICISSPTTVLAANTPTSGAGTWSLISGSGIITTPTLATSSVTGLGLGINVLQWTINGGGCGTNSSTMSIQVDNLPTPAIAGGNQTLCISNPTTVLTGNAAVIGIGTWSVISGSGTITTPTLATSSITGLGVGLNILQWKISNGVCSSTSTLSIQVDNIPTISNAGPSQSLCINSPTTILAGNTPVVGVGTWSLLSGSGIITTPTLSSTTITGLAIGLNTFQWTIANGICSSSSSTMSIQVYPLPTIASAGTSQTLCINNPTTVLTGNTPVIGIGTWSVITGTGTITTPTLATSSITGLAVGINVLEWSISSGACGATTSTINIQVDDVPTISNAGSNQSVCATSASVALNGNVPTVGIGTWSITIGSGVISTSTLANTTVTNLAVGINVLQWTISNGSCGSNTSTMSVQVDQAPTIAAASPNQTICISTPTTTIIGNVPTVGTGSWSLVSGSGTITTANSATTTLTNLAIGTNVFVWTIINGSCVNSTSNVTITVDPAPTPALAGPNQTVCISTPIATMAGNIPAIGTGSWTLVSGTGTITSATLANTGVTNLGLGNNIFAWTISNNCTSSTSNVTITVDPAPTPATVSASQTICISSPSTTVTGNVPAVGTGSWTLVSGSGTITSPTSAVTTITNIGSGVNVFEWTIGNGFCPSSTASVQITVDPLPTIANAGSNQTVCINTPNATMAANNAAIGTGSWSVVSGTGTITNVNLETTTITNLGLGNNIFAWTIFSNCGSSVSNVTITVDPAPTAATASANQTICISSPSITLTGNVPAIGTGSWTLVSGSGTITSPTSAVTTVTNIGLGVNVFEWTIGNGFCPSSTASVQITVDPLPTIANAGANQTVCISSPVATMGANNAAVGTGSWSVVSGTGTITNINLETTTITNLGLGNNVFAWTIFSNCGSSVSNVTITVDPAPTPATASANQTLCVVTPSTTITGNIPAIGTGSWTLVSGSGTITSPTSAITTVTNLGVGVNIFEWTIGNGFCPSSTASVQITVDPLPTIASAGPNQTICINSPVVTMGANNAAVGTGSWSVVSGTGTITNINLETTTITNLGLGNNVFAWTIFSNCGSSTSNVTITVDQAPTTASASPSQTLCFITPTTTISGNIPSVGTGSWTLVSGSGILVSPTLAVTTVTNLGVGTNVFEWSISNGICSPSSATLQIVVNPLPTIASAGANQTICISSPAIMAANNAAVGTGSWNVVSGSGTITNVNLENTSVTNLGAGVNIFAWTISNSCSSSSSTVSITVDQLPSVAMAGINQTFCAATTANLNATNPTVGTGSWSVLLGGASVSNPTLNTSPVTGLGTGTNVFVWTVANGSCPASTASVGIISDALPTIANAGPDQSSCSTSANLSGNSPTVGVGLWSVAGGASSVTNPSVNNSGVTALSTPTNLLVWTITNGVCPASSDTVKVTVLPPTAPAFAGNDTTIYVNQITLNANNPASGSGLWTLVNGSCNILSPTSFNSMVNTIKPGLNTLKWTITDVCGTTEDDINITLIDVELPNAISPNGDGQNDNFEIPFIGSYKKVQIQIINRWGNLVYEDANYNNNWGGQNQSGSPLAEDTYFYVLNLDNIIKNGYITIKR
jgi:gliding motility-associated-like protein